MTTVPAEGDASHVIDVSKPSVARVYDLALGGKDNYESDRVIYRQIMEILPEVPEWAKENRRWLQRAVQWMSREQRIDQYLDLGAGLPTVQNTHQIAQGVNPMAKVVYVDNDPSVIAHGRALLMDNERTDFAAADFTRPDEVLSDPAVKETLDFNRPVGLIQALVLHHIGDLDEVLANQAEYLAKLPSGSCVAISHACNPRDGSEAATLAAVFEDKFRPHFPSLRFRSPAEVTSMFGDFELAEPGLVRLFDWYEPGAQPEESPAENYRAAASQFLICGVARKP
ncbi:SAM-dependent methyltransferase [Kribbella qitaiheensis]|uniref:SAM-dependent methyltransferase n=1 Tax=Kribbella qitaiheensis TaxID=1544730 RepID=UPI001627D83D|nr:SAM-dependent methyltransferase [Kribbella qitaiheensis]